MPIHKTRITETDINNIINLYDLGYSIDQINNITNIDINIIKKYLVMKYDSKIPITEEEIYYFKNEYKSGKSLIDISNSTGRTISVIRNYIKNLIFNKEKLEKDKKIQNIIDHKSSMTTSDILDMYLNSEYTISDIAKYYNTLDNNIKDIIKSYVYDKIPYDSLFKNPINTIKIKIFKDFYCSKGDKYSIDIITPNKEIKNTIITINELYPKIIITDNGSFTYKDIILKAKLVSRKINYN